MSDDPLVRQAWQELAKVLDPELGLDVVALGLVYRVALENDTLTVDLTMTTAACPLSEEIVLEAEMRLRRIPGVKHVQISLVWDPPWGPERMTDAARDILGWRP